jgi:hypothetical protein
MRFLLVSLAFLAAFRSEGGTLSTVHVKTEYSGIDDRWARAMADTLEAARTIYVRDFGFDMPDIVRLDIQCDPKLKTQLYTDGKDGVFLRVSAPDKLARPQQSGTFNLYGMCHELGHMAMYRVLARHDWLKGEALEGWAHYIGSLVVDRVYHMKGESLWPDPYDYRADGSARLQKALAKPGPEAAWAALAQIVGPRGFPRLFQSWQATAMDKLNPLAAVRTPALQAFWEAHANSLIEAPVRSSFPVAHAAAAELSGTIALLAPDDGSAEGERSLGGSAHGQAFYATAPEQYLRAVSIFGARYGNQSGLEFDIVLCDADYKPIAIWTKPYSLFAPGDKQWVRVEVPPIRVPESFYVVVNFHASASNGVYLGIDQHASGASVQGTPGTAPKAIPGGNWMLRAELDQKKK